MRISTLFILILILIHMTRRLDHEKLEVYQSSLAFITWLEPILQRLPKSLAVTDQLDRASTSIPLFIAGGNGKFTPADRCRYFDNARGSALESSAALDVAVARADAVGRTCFRKGSPRQHRLDAGWLDQGELGLSAA